MISFAATTVTFPASAFVPLAVGFFGLGTGYLIYGPEELFGLPQRSDKERLFVAAVTLLDPFARQALEDIDTYLLLGAGEVTATGVRQSAAGGHEGCLALVEEHAAPAPRHLLDDPWSVSPGERAKSRAWGRLR